MSPDPPREDSGDDENRIRRFSGEFIEGVLNDEEFFIVPDAPYELDMEVESDYSDDSEGEEAGASNRQSFPVTRTPHNSVTVEGEEQEFLFTEGQGRARYRLLIPFPTATVVTEEGGERDGGDGEVTRDEVVVQEERSDSGDNRTSVPNQDQSTEETALETEQPSTFGCLNEDKREIEMTEEKVETIKEVMKSITLPSTSIPKWATELDEDSWKRKLNESINSKVANKSDKNAQSSKTT